MKMRQTPPVLRLSPSLSLRRSEGERVKNGPTREISAPDLTAATAEKTIFSFPFLSLLSLSPSLSLRLYGILLTQFDEWEEGRGPLLAVKLWKMGMFRSSSPKSLFARPDRIQAACYDWPTAAAYLAACLLILLTAIDGFASSATKILRPKFSDAVGVVGDGEALKSSFMLPRR